MNNTLPITKNAILCMNLLFNAYFKIKLNIAEIHENHQQKLQRGQCVIVFNYEENTVHSYFSKTATLSKQTIRNSAPTKVVYNSFSSLLWITFITFPSAQQIRAISSNIDSRLMLLAKQRQHIGQLTMP